MSERTDTERLDFLEKTEGGYFITGNGKMTDFLRRAWNFPHVEYLGDKNARVYSVREVIDAAMDGKFL